MAENDERRLNAIENRLAGIEEYLKCCDKEKEDEWKSNVSKALKSIENRQIKTTWQFPFNLGISAMAVGLTWFIATAPITQGDYKSGLFVFSIGLFVTLSALLYRRRK